MVLLKLVKEAGTWFYQNIDKPVQ